MSRTALVLGASGRSGRHASAALAARGWTVRHYRRGGQPLIEAAHGADLIFFGWNPPYAEWAANVPNQTQLVIEAARMNGAAIMLPGNVYVFGQDMPERLDADTPHAATNPLGRVRVALEASLRASGVKTVILRAGDFLDTQASGNWFDRIVAAKIRKGRLSYPGPLDTPHSCAYLPDLGDAFAGLADRLDALPQVTDLTFPGYAVTATELAAACETAIGQRVTLNRMSWLPLHVARPFSPEVGHLFEMRYLWDRPHRLEGAELDTILPERARTPLADAMRHALAPLLG